MKRLSIILKRAGLLLAIYSLDIRISGQTECLGRVRDPAQLFRIEIARSNARRERTKLRGEYNETLPVGHRKMWRMA